MNLCLHIFSTRPFCSGARGTLVLTEKWKSKLRTKVIRKKNKSVINDKIKWPKYKLHVLGIYSIKKLDPELRHFVIHINISMLDLSTLMYLYNDNLELRK